MNKYDGKEGTAIDLLNFYMRTVFKAAGLNWNSDNDVEIQELVKAIIDAAKN